MRLVRFSVAEMTLAVCRLYKYVFDVLHVTALSEVGVQDDTT